MVVPGECAREDTPDPGGGALVARPMHEPPVARRSAHGLLSCVMPPATVVTGGVTTGVRSRRRRRFRSHKLTPSRCLFQSTVRLGHAAAHWLDSYVATTRNHKGQRLAQTRVERYLVAWLGDLRIREVTGDHVRQYRLALEGHFGLSPRTVTHVLSDLRCLLRWAVSLGVLERSPFPPRVMPRIAELPPRGFDDLELEVLARVQGHAGFVLRLLLGTGLRWAEACRATRGHVRGTMLEVAHTKSGRVRRVPLTRELLDVIASHGDRLVPYAVNSPGSFSRMIRNWTGIDDFHVHRCRHTFAMRWLESGGNLAVLQHILGHRDLTTTMRYARVTDALVEQEAARVAARRKPVDGG